MLSNEKSQQNKKQIDSQQSQESNHNNQHINFQKSKVVQSQQIYRKKYENYIGKRKEKKKMVKCFDHGRIAFCQKYQKSISVRLLSTDLQSMEVELHYANYKIKASIIFADIQQNYFSGKSNNKGTFGQVKHLFFKNEHYVINSLPQDITNIKSYTFQNSKIFQQYFLAVIADSLQAGPNIVALFGYDLIFTKNRAFFAMELCHKIQQESISYQQQLKQCLASLHGINFIHSDIKPENIAYSSYHKKHVFIDFGLSRIVKQNFGFKTSTQFKGTFVYCYEQMKKCYMINKKRQVDLYYNDCFALKKSVLLVNFKVRETISENLSYDNLQLQDFQQQFLEQTIICFKLKHAIYFKTPQTTNLLLECSNFKKTLYQIYTHSDLPNSPQPSQINTLIKSLKQQVFTLKTQDSKIQQRNSDQILYEIFSEYKKVNMATVLIPIDQILGLGNRELNQFLGNGNFLYKLFAVFNPFQRGLLRGSQDKREIQVKIVNRVSELVCDQQLQFFSCKIRATLIFLFDALAEFKQIKIFLDLRLLFIAIQDCIQVEKIEQFMIFQHITDPCLKLLKLVQFTLFWCLLLDSFPHKNKQKWQIQCQNCQKQIEQKNLQFNEQTIDFINNIMQFKVEEQLNCKQIDFVVNLFERDKQISRLKLKQSNKLIQQTVDGIVILFRQIIREGVRIQSNVFRSQSTKVYQMKFRNRIPIIKVIGKQFYSKIMIFRSIKQQYNQLAEKQRSFMLTQLAIQQKIRHSSYRIQFLQPHFLYGLQTGLLKNKKMISYLALKFNELVKNNPIFTSLNISSVYFIMFNILYLMDENNKNENQEKLSRIQAIEIISTLREIQKLLMNDEGASKILETCPKCQAIAKIFALKLVYVYRAGQNDKVQQIKMLSQEIYSKLSPFTNKSQKIVNLYLLVLDYEKNKIERSQNKQKNYIFKIFLSITKQYLKSGRLSIFQINTPLFPDVVRMCNHLQQYKLSHSLVMEYINLLIAKAGQLCSESYMPVIFAVKQICEIEKSSLVTLFYQIRQQFQNGINNCVVQFYMFMVFNMVYSFLSPAQQDRQIRRMLLTLQEQNNYKIPQMIIIAIKPCLYRFYIELNLCKRRRKLIICMRHYCKYRLNQKIDAISALVVKKFQKKPDYSCRYHAKIVRIIQKINIFQNCSSRFSLDKMSIK